MSEAVDRHDCSSVTGNTVRLLLWDCDTMTYTGYKIRNSYPVKNTSNEI